MGLFIVSNLYADAHISEKDQQANTEDKGILLIFGRVTDKVTLKPIANAKVTAKTGGVFKEAFTNNKGDYVVGLYRLPWFGFCKITAAKEEYQTQYRWIFLWPWRRLAIVNFKLNDITSPSLEISSPLEGQEISTHPTIELSYSDYGSGINVGSVEIFVNDRDVTEHIEEINEEGAVCMIPVENPLGLGPSTIYAKIKDFTGNLAEDAVSVTVFSEVNQLIQLGKEAILNRDILSAHGYFAQALDVEPNNLEANFYYAITRLGILPMTNVAIFNLSQDMGLTGLDGPLTRADLDPFNFNAQPPEGIQDFDLVHSFPNGERFREAIRYEIIPEMEGSLENLNLVLGDEDFVSYLQIENPFTGTENIEIDFGDIALLKSTICVIKAKAHEFLVRNFDTDLAYLSSLFIQGTLTPRYVLEQYPQLLRVEDTPQSVSARDAFVLAINNYIEGVNFIAAETDDQSDDLISISHAPEYQEQAVLFAEQISDLKKSLISQPDSEFSMKFSQFINLGYFYANPFDLRRVLDFDSANYFLLSNFLPQTEYMLENLSNADVNYQEFLPPDNPFYTERKKDADFADTQAIRTGLEAIRMASFGLLGYELNLDVQEVILTAIEGGNSIVNNTLDAYPELLNLLDPSYMLLAREALNNTVNAYTETVNYLSNNEDPDQSDDLMVPTLYFWDNEPRYRGMLEGLNALHNTLIDPETEEPGDEFHINLAELLTHFKDMRPFLPEFSEDNNYIPGSWPDPTFGGILPDGVPGE